MNCRDFLNEFEERSNLTETATLHLDDCPDCHKTSGEQTRVWQMIDELNQVSAPKNFEFRVKARIANAQPSGFQPRFLPALRYVLPTAIIILLLGFVAFNSLYFSNSESGGQIAASDLQMPFANENLPANNLPANPSAATSNQAFANEKLDKTALNAIREQPKTRRETQFVAGKSPSINPVTTSKTKGKDNFVGTKTSTFTSATIITPENLSPNQKPKTAPDSESSTAISIEQIGQFLGIEAILENGNRIVKSVRENSSAARSGIKVGDVIIELNNQKLSDKTLRTKTIEVKTLTLMRGAEKIEITLQK